MISKSAKIVAAEAACALGSTLADCAASMRAGVPKLRPLGELGVVADSFARLPAGWIPDRSLLLGRRYGAASNVAVNVARQAMARAGWSSAEIEECWIFAGSSRGNAQDMLYRAEFRRPIAQFRASNTMHSEIAAAVSIELNIQGPWQMLSNGCASGLDALGFATQAVVTGLAPRALAVAVDLPLVNALLEDFRSSGLLSPDGRNDPLSPESRGFLPGEGAAAVCVERLDSSTPAICLVGNYVANSDAYSALGLPPDGAPLAALIGRILSNSPDSLAAACLHATGTASHAPAEIKALERTVAGRNAPLPILALKAWTGHTLGASGLLDVAILAQFMSARGLPPNLPGLSSLSAPLCLSPGPTFVAGPVLKIASSLGGHNAALLLEPLAEGRRYSPDRASADIGA